MKHKSLFATIIVTLFFILLSGAKPYDEGAARTIRLFYKGELFKIIELPENTDFIPPGASDTYRAISSYGFAEESDFEGHILTWEEDENGDYHAILTPSTETVTATYIYNFISPAEYSKYTVTFPINARFHSPQKINGFTPNGFFRDPDYTEETNLPFLVENSFSVYVKLVGSVSLKINGVNYAYEYGTPLSEIKGTKTHDYVEFFRDEKHLEKYTHTLVYGLDNLYATTIRTHYKLIVEDKTYYVPVDDASISKPLSADGGPLYFSNGEKVQYPFEIHDDMTLLKSVPTENAFPATGTESDSTPESSESTPALTNENLIAIIVTCSVVFIIFAVFLYEKVIKKHLHNKSSKK